MFLCELDGFIRRKRHKPTLSLERFEELFQAFLLETYHRRISVKGRLVPSERWEEGGLLPRMPESLEQLDLLLMQEVRARKVRRDGIHFHGHGICHSPSPHTSEKMSPFASTRAIWARSEFSTRIASFARRFQRNWQERRFPCETSFVCAINADANSARSSTIGNS